jgi:hypothetical protein
MRLVPASLVVGIGIGTLAALAVPVPRAFELEPLPSEIVWSRWGEFPESASAKSDPIALLMALTERAFSLPTKAAPSNRPAPAEITRQTSWWQQG